MASFIYDGEEIILTPKNMAIAKKQDLMMKAQGIEESYKRQYDFALEVLGVETFNQIFKSDNINEIDLSELTLVCNEINDAYMERIYEQQRMKSEKLASNKAIDKIIQAGNSVQAIEKYSKK